MRSMEGISIRLRAKSANTARNGKMEEPDLFRHIRDELKRTVLLLMEQLRRDHPTDRLYAVMFEVDVSETYVIRIAASEESLSRQAERYAAKGYQARSGDLMELLRAISRWDAPGDSRVGWYWGNQDDDLPVTQLIDQAVQAGLIREYDETQPLRRLCVESLRDLDSKQPQLLQAIYKYQEGNSNLILN